MSDKQETIADIIAEMKREAAQIFPALPIAVLQQATRLEAAHKREVESITPKPDQSWKDICAKCKDGDIEPKYCEYYGEPNGCNSPIYGEHPTTEKSLVVGDCAKLREALKATLDLFWDIHNLNRSPQSNQAYAVIRQIKAALAAPPRNCDVGTAEEQLKRFKDFCRIISKDETCDGCPLFPQCSTLEHCTLAWAQMPYEEGETK